MDKPIALVEEDAGNWVVKKEARDYLKTIRDHQLVVIGVVGKYRTGKSYLMNRFFGVQSGFALGSTIQSETKGIWLWARPHPKDPTKTLVLLDTEGLFDVEKGDQQHDTQLFCLALLLCSCLVYNAVGTLDDGIIQQLHFVSKLTDHIRVKESRFENGTTFCKYFPKMFFVLRDFFLELEINGQPCTADEYLENSLKLKPGKGPKLDEYNELRHCIKTYFTFRRCFTLCKPVEKDDLLRNLHQVTAKDLKEEFMKQATACISTILSEAQPFTVDGNVVTGSRFLQLLKSYIKSMNDGSVPCIASTVALMRTNECTLAISAAIAEYESQIYQSVILPVPSDVLRSCHEKAFDIALAAYSRRALFDENEQYRQKLADSLEDIFRNILFRNCEESENFCQNILHLCFYNVEENVSNGIYNCHGGYEIYINDRTEAITTYTQATESKPAAEQVLEDYLKQKQSQLYAVLDADKKLEMKEKELQRENEEKNRALAASRQLEDQQAELKLDIQRQAADHLKILNNVLAEHERQEEQLKMKHDESMRLVERKMIENNKECAREYKVLMAEAQMERENMRRQYDERLSYLQQTQKQNQQMLDELKTNNQNSREKLQEMQQRLEAQRRNTKKSSCLLM